MKKLFTVLVVLSLSFNLLFMAPVYAAAGAVTVMTLADGTQVSMTSAQLSALATQPGITVTSAPVVAASQVAVPLPASLGGGFVVGEPAALAAGMNTVGITTAATTAGVAGASVTAGAVTVGATAGAAVAGGITAGTVAVGAAAVAAAAGAVAAASSSSDSTPSHDSTTSHTATSHH